MEIHFLLEMLVLINQQIPNIITNDSNEKLHKTKTSTISATAS